MRKITLINVDDSIGNFGIRKIASFIRQNGYRVDQIFLVSNDTTTFKYRFQATFGAEIDEGVKNQILEMVKGSVCVGMSCMTNHHRRAGLLSRAIKEKYPEKKVVLGGAHATIVQEDAIEDFDAVCVGEGEKAFLEYLQRLEMNQNVSTVKNFIVKVGDKIIKNSNRPLLSNKELEEMPFMDYGLKDNYIQEGSKIIKFSEEHQYKYSGPHYRVMYSLGCPFRCTYCSNNIMFKIDKNYSKLRRPSVDYFIQGLLNIKKTYPDITTFFLTDDAFFSLSTKEIQYFAEQFRNKIGLNLKITGAIPTSITEEKIHVLIGAGLKHVRMGIQSGNPRTLDLYGRKISPPRMIKAMDTLSKFKKYLIPTECDIILDNPFETSDDLKETILFLDKLPRPYFLNTFSLEYLPKTSLTKKAIDEKYVESDSRNDLLCKFPKGTFPNLLISLYGVFKMPSFVIKYLVNSKIMNSDMQFTALIKMLKFFNFSKRAFYFSLHGDFYFLTPKYCKMLNRLHYLGRKAIKKL
ncbi:B12-binding domain-containing radical SAM protein [Desulfobacula phenolica]|uniref:Radical SAM superfamily enzyme YgiQ, UPF0313 family n=1 Tax=Desulfobacula phenolica TaxID=90732 RepID=A0A1H2DRQ7_9BACT|nr:radical SAM protein [Desulfobacula phenolica]SDT85555.1 Radical SAM superfamily enzyme YgiQ, UPF0313 family [Desulfobacula phenolica]